MKLRYCTSRSSHSTVSTCKCKKYYFMYCYRRGESEISTGSAWHSLLAGRLRLSFLYFVTFYKSKMKQSPWHLTLMFLHRKTAFYSDISSPFNNFHVVAQNASHSKVQSILPFNSNIFSRSRIKHFCQETVSINWTSLPYIQGIHFITWMGGHSLFLFPLWIDRNEMKLTLDPATM